jgi:AcrR family transcriptional regulator
VYALLEMPRSRSLTDTDIAAAALAVIDRGGVGGGGPPAFTMRAVAAELNMATMSIYRYVSNREQLEELIIEVLFSEVDTTPPSCSSWRKQITTLVERVRDTIRSHPQVVSLGLAHRLTSPQGLRLSEAVLGILTQAGFTGQQRDVANRTLMVYLIGSIQFEHFGQLSGAGTAVMASLPRDEYPLLAATARQAHRLNSNEEFRRGLAIVLDGMQASLT